MKIATWPTWMALVLAVGGLATVSCNNDETNDDAAADGGSPDQAGSVCEVPDDCYPNVDHADLAGTVICNDRVREGYCTHECNDDADCCAVEGECETDLPQVCSPFESSNTNTCFLSCEADDVARTNHQDDQAFCQNEVSASFICRSSGGGSSNRKICVPGDCGVGAGCAETADCAADLDCIDDYRGGYCGVRDCASNADCPTDTLCVQDGDATYCARTCAADSDCSFCRHPDHAAACTSDVAFAEDGTSGTVCVAEHA